ncbi:Cobyric acid synthase [Acidisarcina polymorpha]|uniref:Cobyric acid synthase n=1 Tax=Acidisarcina polymorpha TaxID=2211140 RepID=A0A2Z5G5Y9_9BACT|nr:cobyric acid synthase [Acidisarcina polymorpha]AXC14400.1 Cobyric acid synthase [Acidisarcina polymorpha]
MKARSIMVLGTSSHVGKSLLTAALCRIFADQGIRVAPFKSQNMSLNSAATVEGLEIGRAQALQAEAARVPASVHMNPILLKPAGNMTSQVIVRGKVWRSLSAFEYHRRRVEELMPVIRESYEILASQNDVIVLEGAGSPAEINLKENDIVNMRMAEMADASCILVGDIDRGGVFASLLGTVQLLDPSEQARIRGFVINKFRGDIALLQPGIRMIEDRLQRRCLGVVPFLHQLTLDEEDSLGLPAGDVSKLRPWIAGDEKDRPLRIAVVALPSFSNFTDFDALRNEPSVDLRFSRNSSEIANADVVVLPGSKQTVDDLLWLRQHGLDAVVSSQAALGLVVGICGGFQMLGQRILDPHGIEHEDEAEGLGLLPFVTRMNPDKVTRQASGYLAVTSLFGEAIPSMSLQGYEIHLGETFYAAGAQTFSVLHNGQPDGCISPDKRIFGTYLHGIFDDDGFRHTFITAARAFHALTPALEFQDWKRQREEALDRLADAVRMSLDLPRIFDWVGLTYQPRVESVVMEHAH